MKIIIVGAGISGLSLYLFLQKHLPKPSPPSSHTVVIYESHQVPLARESSRNVQGWDRLVIGGGIGVAPNGMKNFAALDKEIHDEILKRGYPVQKFQFNAARGWVLGSMGTGNASRWGDSMVMVCRQDVWDVLRKRVPDQVVHQKCKVKEVKGRTIEGGMCTVIFEDGTVEEADLVIGADGVKSIVRTAVLSDGYPPRFEGLLGVGGICPSSFLPPKPSNPDNSFSPTVLTFGRTGFFGYSISSSAPETSLSDDESPAYGPEAIWWSSYECKEVPDKKTFDKGEINYQLQARHSSWKDPAIQHIIKNVKIDAAGQSWTVPKLPEWQKDGLILLGDSAHALPTTSGQGVSQALEDCHALSLLMSHYLSQSYSLSSPDQAQSKPQPTVPQALALAASKYVSLRRPRTSYLLDYSQRMANHKKDQGIVAEMLTYGVFWLFTRVMSNSQMDFMFGYDVPTEVGKVLSVEGSAYEQEHERALKKWF